MHNKDLQGILWGALSFFLYSLGDVCQKFMGQSPLPYLQSLFLFTSIGTLFLVLPPLLKGKTKSLIPNNKKAIVIFSLIGVLNGFLNIVSFSLLPMVTVYIALFTSPLFISIFGKFFLKEPLDFRRTLLLLISFSGALFALNPLAIDASTDTPLWVWFILPLLPVTFSTLFIFLRVLRKTETQQALTATPSALRALYVMPLGLYMWETPTLDQMLLVTIGAFLFSTAHRTLAYANKLAPTTLVSPTHYSQLVYGAVLGYLFWNDVPTWHTVIGATIIVISGLSAAKLTKAETVAA